MATLLCPGGCIAALVRLLTGWGWDGLDIGALRYLEYCSWSQLIWRDVELQFRTFMVILW